MSTPKEVETALRQYAKALKRLSAIQELKSEACYWTSTHKSIVEAVVALLGKAESELSEARVELNEAILREKLP